MNSPQKSDHKFRWGSELSAMSMLTVTLLSSWLNSKHCFNPVWKVRLNMLNEVGVSLFLVYQYLRFRMQVKDAMKQVRHKMYVTDSAWLTGYPNTVLGMGALFQLLACYCYSKGYFTYLTYGFKVGIISLTWALYTVHKDLDRYGSWIDSLPYLPTMHTLISGGAAFLHTVYYLLAINEDILQMLNKTRCRYIPPVINAGLCFLNVIQFSDFRSDMLRNKKYVANLHKGKQRYTVRQCVSRLAAFFPALVFLLDCGLKRRFGQSLSSDYSLFESAWNMAQAPLSSMALKVHYDLVAEEINTGVPAPSSGPSASLS